jgi:hypothetical protein
LVAPLTFISTLALIMQQRLLPEGRHGFETMQIVQVDQKFLYHKPILAGDKVWGRWRSSPSTSGSARTSS